MSHREHTTTISWWEYKCIHDQSQSLCQKGFMNRWYRLLRSTIAVSRRLLGPRGTLSEDHLGEAPHVLHSPIIFIKSHRKHATTWSGMKYVYKYMFWAQFVYQQKFLRGKKEAHHFRGLSEVCTPLLPSYRGFRGWLRVMGVEALHMHLKTLGRFFNYQMWGVCMVMPPLRLQLQLHH